MDWDHYKELQIKYQIIVKNYNPQKIDLQLDKEIKDSLDELRTYLDSVGYKMPDPIYPYQENDQKTWRYLHGHVSFSEKTKAFRYLARPNPEYKYKQV